MTGQEWVAAFAERMGIDAPDPETMDRLLELAGVAAHASERLAAPLTCYLVGTSGTSVEAALVAARALAGDQPRA